MARTRAKSNKKSSSVKVAADWVAITDNPEEVICEAKKDSRKLGGFGVEIEGRREGKKVQSCNSAVAHFRAGQPELDLNEAIES